MSTRSVIARPDADGFKGVYHHWDGYPRGLGATLFQVHRDVFDGDTPRMLRYLIDEHPAGWSTIVNAEWSLPAGPRADRALECCNICGQANWTHYRQYYRTEYNVVGKRAPAGTEIMVLGHQPEHVEQPHGPEAYASGENSNVMTHENASGSGCEWAYVIDEQSATMSVLECVTGDGSGHMTGMFGYGDPAGQWVIRSVIRLAGAEPDWEAIEAAA